MIESCIPGSTLDFTMVVPGGLTDTTQYWKYGPEPGNMVLHWYVLPGVGVAGDSLTFSITDGAIGDSDLTADGEVSDPGGPGHPPAVISRQPSSTIQDGDRQSAPGADRSREIREARKRDLFELVYGAKGVRALFAGKPVVPVDATPLRRVGRIVVGKLEDPELELPLVIRKGIELTLSDIAREISEPLVEMETAMQDLEELKPGSSATLEAKKRAHAAVDDKTARFARFLEGLYGMEGHDVLAARVRQSSHQSKWESAEAVESEGDARLEDVRKVADEALESAAPKSGTKGTTESSGPGQKTSKRAVSPRPATASRVVPHAATQDTRIAGGRTISAAPSADWQGVAARVILPQVASAAEDRRRASG